MFPMRVDEAARQLGVTSETVRRWARAGRLPHVRRGRALDLDPADVAALRATTESFPLPTAWESPDQRDWVDLLARSRGRR